MASRFAGIKTNARSGNMELNKTAKSLREIAGIDVYSDKAKGEVKDMMQILQELNGVWDTLNQDQRFAIGEAVAGLEHANTFQALMGNWEDVLQFQEDYKNGFTIGSAEKENERYLDSIEGKLNVLKENMKSLLTTTISSDMFKSAIDGLIKFTDGLNKVLQALDKVGAVAPVVFGTIAGLVSGMKGFNSLSSLRLLTTGWTKDMTLMQKAISSKTDAMTLLGGATAKAGAFLKNFLAQGLLIAGVTIAVKALAKAWDYANNSVKNTAKELQEVEDGQLSTIKSHNEKITTLQTVGKEYETLANKAKKTAEEEARMLELGNELARVMPELQIGTDENGNAILSMTTDMQGYINKTKEAIEQQNRLLMGTRLDQADNALKMLTKGEGVGKDGYGLNEQKINEQNLYYTKMKQLETEYRTAMHNARNKDGEGQKKALEDARRVKNEMIKVESEHMSKYGDIQARIMEQAGHYRDAMNSIWQDSASLLINDLTPEMEKSIEQFVGLMDFTEIDSQFELDSVKNMFRELPKLVQDGTVNLETLSTQLKDINSEFARTGNLEEYNSNMEKLAQSMSKDTGWDASILQEMFTVVTDGSLKGASSLDNFLQAFGKTTQELMNGDNVAKEIQKQFASIENAIESINNNDFSSEIATYNLRVKLQTDENLPQQVKDMVNNLANMGADDTTILTLTAEVLMAFKDGKIDTKELDILKEQADKAMEKSLKEDGKEYTQEMKLKVHGFLESLNSEEILSDIDEKLGEGEVEKSVTVTVDGEGAKKVKDVEEALSILEKRPDVLNEVRTVIDGDEDLVLYAEIIKNLPVGKEYTNKFIVENKEAIANMKTYQEVAEYINALPDDVKKTYGFNVEGGEETIETVETINKEVEKDKVVEIKANNGEVLDSIKDIETLIELSAKVEDGKYKLEFDANTQEAVTQLQKLKEEVNFLSNQLMQVPTTEIDIRTEQSAKNLTGLKTRISETKTALESLSSKNVNINTALSAKNLSGLIVRVQQYSTAIGGVLSRNINVNTALSAKNISGLIRKIQEYNNTKVKNITISSNAKTVASQINSIKTALNQLPTSKTVTVNVKQNGSTQKIKNNVAGISATPDSVQPQIKPLSEFSSDVLSNTLNMQHEALGIKTPPPAPSRNGMLRGKTQATPISKDFSSAIKYSVEILAELENRLKLVTNQISLLDKAMKHASGEEKIKYLEKQNELYEEQKGILLEQIGVLEKQQEHSKKFLEQQGFNFNGDGNFTNYEEKLTAMEKEAERLDEIAEAKRKAESDYKGNDQKQKDKLSKEYDDAKAGADKYRDSLAEVKKYLEQYTQVAFTDLPKVKEDFVDIDNTIKDNINSVKEFEKAISDLRVDSGYKDNERDIKDIENQLAMNKIKQKNAGSEEKKALLEEELMLTRQLQKEKQELLEFEKKTRDDIMKQMAEEYGFKFRDDGSIEGYGQKIEELKKTLPEEEFNKVFGMVEEYLEKTNDTIPRLEQEWEEFNNQIIETSGNIDGLKKELDDLKIDSGYKDNERDIKDIENQLAMNKIKQENASYEERKSLLEEELMLTKKLQKEKKELLEFEKDSRDDLMKQLAEQYGFKFRDDGSIEGYGQKIEELKKILPEEEFNKVFGMVEQYLEKTNDTIPKLEQEWESFNNQIIETSGNIDALKKELDDLTTDSRYKDEDRDMWEVKNKLDKNDTEMELAQGEKYAELLRERIELKKQERKETQDMLALENKRRDDLMGSLGDYGFTFREDGSIEGYGQKIEELKKTLPEEEFNKVFGMVEDYLDTTYQKIPELENEWNSLGNEIIKYNLELDKIDLQNKLDKHLNKLQEINNEYDKLSDRLSIIDIKLKHASGKEKIELLEEQIRLLEEQKKKQEEMETQYKAMMFQYQDSMKKFGFEFNAEGDILNLDEILNSNQSSPEIERIKELVEEYLDVQRNKLPEAQKEWESLNSAIKDAYKEQLNVTKEVEDKILAVYKKQLEERKKLIDSELDARLKALKKEQDAYNEARDEAKYDRDYEDQLSTVEDLQKKLEIAMKDNSLSGQKKVQELLKQLQEEQRKLEDMVQDKIDSNVNDMFDKESERLEEEAQNAKDDLDEKYSDDKLQQIVKDALTNGVFVDIDGNIKDLQETLLDFEDKFGDGMTAIGAIIKDELVTNLEIAKETMKDFGKILNNLDLGQFAKQGMSRVMEMRSESPKINEVSNHNIHFNSPLINISGNVDGSIVSDLKEVARNIEEVVTRNIIRKIK